jgi:hypothetical protein
MNIKKTERLKPPQFHKNSAPVWQENPPQFNRILHLHGNRFFSAAWISTAVFRIRVRIYSRRRRRGLHNGHKEKEEETGIRNDCRC